MTEAGPIRQQVDASIAAATHLTDADQGAVAALQMLADRIDLLAVSNWIVDGKLDNVSVPTFLRYCESLGMTPAGRKSLEAVKKESTGGKLAQLRAVTNRSA